MLISDRPGGQKSLSCTNTISQCAIR